jgi:hypothetical protein
LFWRAAAGVGGGDSPKSDMVGYAARVRDEGAQEGTQASKGRAETRAGHDNPRQEQAGTGRMTRPAVLRSLSVWGSDAYHFSPCPNVTTTAIQCQALTVDAYLEPLLYDIGLSIHLVRLQLEILGHTDKIDDSIISTLVYRATTEKTSMPDSS